MIATPAPSTTRQRRVLVITPDFPPQPGGIQVLVHRLVSHFRRLEAAVVTRGAQGAAEFDGGQRLRILRSAPPELAGHRAAVALLNLKAVRGGVPFRPDVVLSGHIVTSPAAWLLRRATGAPFLQYLYAHEVAARPRLARFAIQQADAVVAISDHTERLARECGAHPARLHLIPPGVDISNGSRAQRSVRPLVVTISRLVDSYKGHDAVIAAMQHVRERVPDVLWVVVGDGPLRPVYEDMVRQSGLESHVRFLGAVTDSERDEWLDRAHVLTMPSRVPPGGGGEGFGIVYLEAGAHGVPVVAGQAGGALDAVVPGVTGLLVDPADPGAIAEAISGLLLDRGRAAAMGRNGARRALDFSWPRVAGQVEELLLRLAESSR